MKIYAKLNELYKAGLAHRKKTIDHLRDLGTELPGWIGWASGEGAWLSPIDASGEKTSPFHMDPDGWAWGVMCFPIVDGPELRVTIAVKVDDRTWYARVEGGKAFDMEPKAPPEFYAALNAHFTKQIRAATGYTIE